MLNCFDVANYLVWLATNSSGAITHLKLQKLTYYAQGFHLAIYGDPLFKEKIEAWDKGPVVRQLWNKYKQYGGSPIQSPKDFDISLYSEQQIVLLDGVHKKRGHYSAPILSEMTHQEEPWINTHPQKEITKESMTIYFKTKIDSDNLQELRVKDSVKESLKLESDMASINSYSEKSSIRDSKGFQAYLASKEKRFEVYKNLADA